MPISPGRAVGVLGSRAGDAEGDRSTPLKNGAPPFRTTRFGASESRFLGRGITTHRVGQAEWKTVEPVAHLKVAKELFLYRYRFHGAFGGILSGPGRAANLRSTFRDGARLAS